MNSGPYSYTTDIEWGGRRRGYLHTDGCPNLTLSTPPEFRGEAGFWTPEHLFVAAAESCLMATFVGIAENSRLAVASYRSTARGRLEWGESSGWTFREITIAPVIELEKPEDQPLAERVLAKAEKGCLIARSMTAVIRVEPQFTTKAVLAA